MILFPDLHHEELGTENDQAANERVTQHIDEIRKVKNQSDFYLPLSQYQQDELIVCFDRIHSTDSESVDRDELTVKQKNQFKFGWLVYVYNQDEPLFQPNYRRDSYLQIYAC